MIIQKSKNHETLDAIRAVNGSILKAAKNWNCSAVIIYQVVNGKAVSARIQAEIDKCVEAAKTEAAA